MTQDPVSQAGSHRLRVSAGPSPLFTPAAKTPPALPVRVPAATELPPPSAAPLPEWVICVASDYEHGRDPDAAPEWELCRHCEGCGTSCYVKPDFVRLGFRVMCWGCFRAKGGRRVSIHPDMEAEYRRAGLEAWAWEGLAEIQRWLEQADAQPTHVSPLTAWWANRRKESAR